MSKPVEVMVERWWVTLIVGVIIGTTFGLAVAEALSHLR